MNSLSRIRHAAWQNLVQRAHFAILAIAALTAGCANTPPPQANKPDILNASLRQAYAEPARALTEQRTPLSFADGRVVNNCNAYLGMRRDGIALGDGAENHAVAGEYLICDALPILATALGPADDSACGESHGKVLAERLDLRSFPSSLGPRLDDQVFRLDALGLPLIHTVSHAKIDTAQQIFHLEVVAIGDFDHNGQTDWLVWLTDEAGDGSYRDHQTLLIYNVAAPGLLHAQAPYSAH